MSVGNSIKLCPFPFSRIELGLDHNEFVPCCYTWFTDEYHSKFKDTKIGSGNKSLDVWSGEQAVALRESVLDGSYRYCNTSRCNKPEMTLTEKIHIESFDYETPITRNNLGAIFRNEGVMPDSPSSVSMSGDVKCNLACPTCRSEMIVTSSEEDQTKIKNELQFINQNRENISVIKLSNGGEVFFSKDQRDFLKSLNRFDYPLLNHVFIVTNGLLFNQRNMDALFPGSSFIKKVAISIDAGNEETYAKTRGGNWKTLLENLKWAGQKRKNKELLSLNFNFVLRKENYESLDELITIARTNNVDFVELIKYDDWSELYDSRLELSKRYKEEAIHLKSHPEHQKLLNILQKYKDSLDVRINIDGIF